MSYIDVDAPKVRKLLSPCCALLLLRSAPNAPWSYCTYCVEVLYLLNFPFPGLGVQCRVVHRSTSVYFLFVLYALYPLR